MTRLINLLTVLLRSEIAGEELDKSVFTGVGEDDWKQLYQISKAHDLAHLVGDAALKYELLADGETKDKFRKQVMTAYYRYEKMRYELENVKSVLNRAEIPFVPLKGAVMRQYYPQPWMRTSSDVDILIHEEDISQATAAFTEQEYAQNGQTPHDISFTTSSGVHLELHHSLIEAGRIGKAEQLLNHIWNYTKPIAESSEYALDDEMFYYYHLAHMAKHLEGGGGCGIRSFLDLWILNRLPQIDVESRNALLLNGGLDKFAAAANELSDFWMEGKEPSKLAKRLEAFIISGGIYGTSQNAVVIGAGKRKSKFRYLLNRIWMPYDRLIGEYPSLRGKRILQPFYEVRRWFRLFKKDTFKRSRAELKASTSVSEEQAQQTTQMLSDLGLL